MSTRIARYWPIASFLVLILIASCAGRDSDSELLLIRTAEDGSEEDSN